MFLCREILDGERKPTVSNGNNGGMDMMVDDKGVRIRWFEPFTPPTAASPRSINEARYLIFEAFQMDSFFYFVILQPIYKD